MNPELPGPAGYCSSQLIPYLGNKRSLLPRLQPVFMRLAAGLDCPRFIDPFAGSGAVSRLARASGMQVAANDWEPYSEAINSSWLCLRPSDLDKAFGGAAGLSAFFMDWNAMHPSAVEPRVPGSAASEPYIARWFAPADTFAPRLGHERLFYTAENATFIDRVRTRLESEYPSPAPGSVGDVRRRVVMGALLLEAAVHANTSGVFKAFHHGFGGHGGDALSRILGRMVLEAPILPESMPASVFKEDATTFVAGRPADIAYFDPPYNQHQYGSNYHLLNTILRWDRKPMPMDVDGDAAYSSKAGIPVSWKATRSSFCVRSQSGPSVAALLDACEASMLVFSWNADGHLSGEDMVSLLSPRGHLETLALDYIAYRGGRQSASRTSRSREYLFIVDTRAEPVDTEEALAALGDLASRDEVIRSSYDPERVARAFSLKPRSLHPAIARPDLGQGILDLVPEGPFPESQAFFSPDLRQASDNAGVVLSAFEPGRRRAFMEAAAACACNGIVEELSVLLSIASDAARSGRRGLVRRTMREAPRLLRKLAHDKYAADFNRFLDEFKVIGGMAGDSRLARELLALERLLSDRVGTTRI